MLAVRNKCRSLVNSKYLKTLTVTRMETLRKTEKEISINAPWGNIAALTWGSPSNPPVLFCHGKQDACSGFRPLVSLLPSCFYYVSIDLPGNGRSDHLPPGVRYSAADLVPSILNTVKHFNWKKFIYIGHSLGVPVGKKGSPIMYFNMPKKHFPLTSKLVNYFKNQSESNGKLFNIAYPGYISRTVELDPIPAHHTWPSTQQDLQDWYHRYYAYYDEVSYAKHNGGLATAPKYTLEKAQNLVMSSRNLSKEAAEHVLERCLVPAGDGLYRFTFDQRMKEVTILPFSSETLQQIYTSTKTPTFCILSKKILDAGLYKPVPFLTNESSWPNGNYKVKIVEGWHDVHIEDPACMADDIAKFLLDDLKAKL